MVVCGVVCVPVVARDELDSLGNGVGPGAGNGVFGGKGGCTRGPGHCGVANFGVATGLDGSNAVGTNEPSLQLEII